MNLSYQSDGEATEKAVLLTGILLRAPEVHAPCLGKYGQTEPAFGLCRLGPESSQRLNL